MVSPISAPTEITVAKPGLTDRPEGLGERRIDLDLVYFTIPVTTSETAT